MRHGSSASDDSEGWASKPVYGQECRCRVPDGECTGSHTRNRCGAGRHDRVLACFQDILSWPIAPSSCRPIVPFQRCQGCTSGTSVPCLRWCRFRIAWTLPTFRATTCSPWPPASSTSQAARTSTPPLAASRVGSGAGRGCAAPLAAAVCFVKGCRTFRAWRGALSPFPGYGVGAAMLQGCELQPHIRSMVMLRAETCDKCKNANPVTYRVVPEEAWTTVVLNRWRRLCPGCFERRGGQSRGRLQLREHGRHFMV